MQSPSEVARILTDAADYLEVNGWVQGTYGDDGGPRCIMGAIASVEKRAIQYDIEGRCVATGTLGNYLGMIPHEWNDSPFRDQYEAIDCLKHAAKAVANGEVDLMSLRSFREDLFDGAA